MPLDGAFINCLKSELSVLVNCHIDKIHLPSKNEYVFSLRGKGFSKKLYISLSPDCPRVSFTNQSFENPAAPPMFCMFIRKHICGGKITNVETMGAERIIIFTVSATNEMGDKVNYRLILEFLGSKTNLILCTQEGKILDSARRSDIETSSRLILPGAFYSAPEKDSRLDFLTDNPETAVENIIKSNLPLSEALLKNIGGISPLICREISFLLFGSCEELANKAPKTKLISILNKIKNIALNGGAPYYLTDKNGVPKEFSFLPITQYGDFYDLKKAESFSDMLEIFYAKREQSRRTMHLKSDILKLVKNLIARNNKKLLLRKAELKKSENADILRIYGELIKANLYRIDKGATQITVENFYDNCKPVTIKLNAAISPQANAAKYFKDYKKACTASQTLGKLIEECEKEDKYLNSVLFELENAKDSRELNEIKAELRENGYIKVKKGDTDKKNVKASKPLIFEKNGFKIAVGRNNIQNDILTLKTAAKSDLWFHTKNIHGSHVILFTEGKVPDDETLYFAANLAAKYSKGENSNQVPVDYTYAKFVKKPSGAKTGMVIYTDNKTIFANPSLIKSEEE